MTTYYWRGSTGNFSNPSGWDIYNNFGTLVPAGQAPGGADTAVIDSNSMVLSGDDAFGGALDFVGAILALGGNTLTLSGAVTWSGAVVAGPGTLADGATIDTSGGILDGVTYQGALALASGSALYVENGLTLETATGGTPGSIDLSACAYAGILVLDSETLDNATLTLGGNGGNDNFLASGQLVLGDGDSGHTLTLGSGFTIDAIGAPTGISSATNQYLGFDPSYGADAGDTLDNAGLIDVSGYSNSALYVYYGTFVNTGSIVVSGGALNVENSLTNNSSISLSGGQLEIDGTLQNAGGTLFLSAGAFDLSYTIAGGTVVANGATIDTSGGILDGVTYQGALALASGSALYVENGLTLETAAGGKPGSIDLSACAYAGILVLDSETLDNATLTLGGNGGNDNFLASGQLVLGDGDSGHTLTLGSGFTIDAIGAPTGISSATNQYLGFDPSYGADAGDTLDNAGLIDVSGYSNSALYVYYGTFVNTGSIVVSGGALNVENSLTNNSSISLSGGQLEIDGTLQNAGGTLFLSAGAFDLSYTIAGGTVVANGATIDTSGGILDGVTYQGALALASGSALYVENGLTLETAAGGKPGSIDLSACAYAGILVLDSETLDNATLTLGGNGGNDNFLASGQLVLGDGDSGHTLTLGSGFTIDAIGAPTGISSATNQYLGFDPSYGADAGDTLDNAGLIDVSGYSNSALYVYYGTFVNTGSIVVSGGALNVENSLTNNSSISLSGGQLEIDGTLQNAGGTLFLSAGAFDLSYTIAGGTVVANGATIDTSGGILDGVTYQGALALASGSALYVENGLTLETAAGGKPGSIDLSACAYAGILVLDSETLDNATLTLGGNGGNDNFLASGQLVLGDGDSGHTLTLGSGFTIDAIGAPTGISSATNQYLGFDPSYGADAGDTLDNAGLIDVSGYSNSALYVYYGTFVNTGSIVVSGGALNVENSLTNNSSISLSGGQLEIDGTLQNAGGTLFLSAGAFDLSYTIAGGTVVANGATIDTSGGILDGVTYQGALALASGSALYVENGLTLETATGGTPGSIDLSACAYAGILVLDSETLDNATLTLGGNGGNDNFLASGQLVLGDGDSGHTLTLGSGFTIDAIGAPTGISSATNQYLGFDPSYGADAGDTLDNAGLIDVSGYSNSALYVYYGTFVNTGSIAVSGGALNLQGSVDNTGSVTVTENAAITAAAFADTGLLQLGGGSFTASSFTVAGGLVLGFGAIGSAILNNGTVEAQNGLLTLGGTVTGTGGLVVDPGATLELAVATAQGVKFNPGVPSGGTLSGATLKLDAPATYTGTISGLGVGDTIDLVGVVASDPTLNGSTLTVAVQSGGSLAFAVSDISGVPIPVAQTDGGTGTDIVMFGLAQPSAAAPNPVVIPNEHVGDAITQAVTLENTAPADSDYENLDATIGSATAGITASGSFTGLVPQATDSTDLLVGLDTTTDGVKSGSATISLFSDGTGIDNQGTTALPSQTVSVTGTVYALAAPAFAPTLTTLASFNGSGAGDTPAASLIADAAGDLFGTTPYGGANSVYLGNVPEGGTAFELVKTAAGYASTPTTLVSFDGSGAFNFDNTTGADSWGGLTADAAGNLFGTTSEGGANGYGTVFEILYTDGTYASTPTTLVNFNVSDGATPFAGLISDAAGDLFGTTADGGANGDGTVFEIANTATGYASTPTILVNFDREVSGDNETGDTPMAGLMADASGDLFGTTENGGSDGLGTVFELTNTGAGYTLSTLVNFNGVNGESTLNGPLIRDAAGDLFGITAINFGADSAVFELINNGGGSYTLTTLASFNGIDGNDARGGLIMDAAGDLFGTTSYGAAFGAGTVFELAKTSTGYASAPTTLASFDGNSGGSDAPLLADAAGNLFGTTQGGVNSNGSVFELSGVASEVNSTTYSLNFGAARVGDTVAAQPVSIADGATGTTANPYHDPYQESLIYSLQNSLPAGFTAVSGSSGTVESGGIGTASLILDTSTAGDFTGSTATLSLTSTGVGTSGLADTILPSDTIDLNGKVYAPAVAQPVATSLDFGVVHVGDTVTQAMTIANAAAGALTDSLIGGFGTVTGPFSGSGTLNAAAGSFGTLAVGLDTTASGVETGSAALALDSHDADLADIAISAGPISLTGTVDNYATVALEEVSGGGTFTQTGSDYALNLGKIGLGETAPIVDLEALNAAAGLADLLSGTFQVSGSSAFLNSGTASFSGLAAGQADTEPSVSLSTAQIGTFSETLTLTATGSNSSGYSGTLAPETLTITGTVVSPGLWATDAPGNFDDPIRWTGDIVPTVTTSASIDFADDPQVLHNTGSDTVHSLTNTAGDFIMAGGTLTTPLLENDSLMSWTGGSLILNSGTGGVATLLNIAGAGLTITPSGQRLSTTGSGTASVSNAGTIVAAGGVGIANIDVELVNTGQVVVNQGTLSLNGGGSSNGAGLAGGAGGVLQFGLPDSGIGNTFSITSGEYAVGNTTVNGGTLDLSAASGIFFVDSLRLAGAGTLLLGAQNATAQDGFVQGPTSWAGATGTPFLSGTGTLTVYGGGSLIDGVESGSGLTRLIGTNQLGAIDLDGGRTVENDGWMTWSLGNIELGAGDGSAAVQSGTITNVLGATFYVTADGRIGNPGAGTSQFDNAGVTAVFAGTGETDIDAYVDNTGYIQAQTGTLSLNGGGTSDGAHLYVTNGAVVQFGTMAGGAAGGTFSIVSGQYTAGDTAITGGTLDVSAASGAVFADQLAIGAGALLLGAQANAVVQGELLQTGGLLRGSALLAVYDGASLTGGVQSGAATTRLYGTSVLGGSFALDGGRTLENDGWLNWSSGNVTLGSGDPSAATQSGTLSNVSGATVYVTADGRIATSGAGSGTVDNAGVIAVFAGAGETDIDAALNDTGGLQVQSGVLGLNGGGTLAAGSLYVAPNALLQFGTAAATGVGGTFVFTGGPYIASNTAVNAGVVDLSAVSGVSFGTSLSIAGSGTLLLGGNFPGAANFAQSGGELSGTGYFYVTGAAQLAGGLETGSGRTVLQGGGSIGGPVAFDGGRSLENEGALSWTGGSITLGGGDTDAASQSATLINDAGAVFDIETNGTINSAGFSGSGTINNAGTILSNSLGTTAVYANLFNNGVVDVSEGALALEQGVGGTGTFLLDGTATLDFVNGAGSSNTMQFLLPGGTLEVDATGQFGPTISGFAAGDVIDAGGVGFVTGTTTVGFNAGTLTMSEGSQSAAFILSGSYAVDGFHIIGSDGHGGTAVGYS